MRTNNLIMQRVRHVDYANKTALVLNRKGRAYSVNLSDKVIAEGIHAKDLAFIKIINGLWIITDFERHNTHLPSEVEYADDFMEEY